MSTKQELESVLEAHFNLQIRKMGGKTDKIAPTRKGMPDRMVLMPGGRILLVELKRAKGVPSASQKVWHAEAKERGVRVHVLAGRAQTDRWLERLRKVIENG